jgi:hypothetical protein
LGEEHLLGLYPKENLLVAARVFGQTHPMYEPS